MDEVSEKRTDGKRKISWWKVAVGVVLVFGSINGIFFADPRIPEVLKTSNESQQSGAFLAMAVLFILGLGFLVAGLRSLWLEPKE
jgi:hypothetical protein